MVGFSPRGWFQLRFQALVQTKLASKARRFSGSWPYLLIHCHTSLLLSLALDSVGYWNCRSLSIIPLLCSCCHIGCIHSFLFLISLSLIILSSTKNITLLD